MPVDRRDYYEVLGVPRDAAEEVLKRAYRKAALRWHPDRNPGNPEAAGRFKEAAEAYQVLTDPQKRPLYDKYGHAGVGVGAGGASGGPGGEAFAGFRSPDDVFEALFGGRGGVFEEFFGRPGRPGPERGAHLVCELDVSFEEMARGSEKAIRVRRREACGTCRGSGAKPGTSASACAACGGSGAVTRSQGFFSLRMACPRCGGQGRVVKSPCGDCRGSGRVERDREITVVVPAGVEDGARLRLAGQGEAGESGAPPGDLFCEVRVRPHPVFERDGLDLRCEVPISFSRAALGGEVEVPTLEGLSRLRIPRGAQSGQVLRMRGLGLPDPRGRGRGDALVRVVVEVPQRLSRREEEILHQLEGVQEANPGSARKSFLDRLKELFG